MFDSKTTSKDMTARVLFEELLEELDKPEGQSEFDDAPDAVLVAAVNLLGHLAQAQAIERLSRNIERLVDTYQMNSI